MRTFVVSFSLGKIKSKKCFDQIHISHPSKTKLSLRWFCPHFWLVSKFRTTIFDARVEKCISQTTGRCLCVRKHWSQNIPRSLRSGERKRNVVLKESATVPHLSSNVKKAKQSRRAAQNYIPREHRAKANDAELREKRDEEDALSCSRCAGWRAFPAFTTTM